MELFWGDESDDAQSRSSTIAPMFHQSVPETRKITQITGYAPPSAVLAEAQARKEINVCKTGPKDIPNQLKRDFASGKRNAAACLNEVCQLQRWKYDYNETNPSKPFDAYGRANFAIMAVVNGVQYTPGEGRNKKDAKVEAARNALNEILGQNPDQIPHMQSGRQDYDMYGRAVPLHNKTASSVPLPETRMYKPIPKPVMPQKTNFLPAPSRSVQMEMLKRKIVQPHESVGALAEKMITDLLNKNPKLLAAAQYGVTAQFIVKKAGLKGEVVALGTGDMCCDGGDLITDGTVLFDCHAETIARRAFRRYLLNQIRQWYIGQEDSRKECIFEKTDDSNLLCLKDTVTIHLYLNKPPKGVARNIKRTSEQSSGDELNLTFLQDQGSEETRVPSYVQVSISASDVLSMNKRKMVTMSGTDKITKWNICGVQGSLLSLLIEPVCLSSITIGFDNDAGDCHALSQGVNGRLDDALNQYLPDMFFVNHINKIGSYFIKNPKSMVAFFEDMDHLSINWTVGDENVEIVDGNTGKIERTCENGDSPSRTSKLAFYASCMTLNIEMENTILQPTENYHLAKHSCQSYQDTKRVLGGHLRESGRGYWVNRPKQVDCFKV
ncbi:adenosine deaminase domain-containing protein 1-like [Styela clava]